MSELAAACAVAFKCVRRSVTGATFDSGVRAFDTFIRSAVPAVLPYLSDSDMTWVRP
jgi:hypothetical protein